jgi:hypothetical protein
MRNYFSRAYNSVPRAIVLAAFIVAGGLVLAGTLAGLGAALGGYGL